MLATCCRAGGVDGRRSQGLTARLLLLRLLRADMPGWRRTLAEVLQLRKPVVVSMYCEHEGHKMTRQLNWVEQEFSEAAFQQCDRIVRHWFAAHAEQHIAEAGQGTPPDDVRHTIGPVHRGACLAPHAIFHASDDSHTQPPHPDSSSIVARAMHHRTAPCAWQAHILWRFAPNPHAHAPPRNCYEAETHGVRNSFWMAFSGARAPHHAPANVRSWREL
jgi:hypothetical protein